MLAAVSIAGKDTEIQCHMGAIDADDMLVFHQEILENKIVFEEGSELTTFEIHDGFLMVGCSSCNEGKGWLRFFDSVDLTEYD